MPSAQPPARPMRVRGRRSCQNTRAERPPGSRRISEKERGKLPMSSPAAASAPTARRHPARAARVRVLFMALSPFLYFPGNSLGDEALVHGKAVEGLVEVRRVGHELLKGILLRV